MFATFSKVLFLLTIMCAISACSTLPDQSNIETRAKQFAAKSSKSSQSLLQLAKLKLQKADTELLAFYAPTYLYNANQSYEEATTLYKQEADDSDIRHHAQLTVQYVESGLRNKKMVTNYLADSLQSRAVLEKLNAPSLFPNEFQTITEQHLELIKQVEQRKEREAKANQKPIIQAMQALEVKTVEQTHLGKTQTMLKQAEALNAAKLLPKTYADTLNQIQQIEHFIAENPRQKKKIKAFTQDSLFAAERLYSLTRLANKIVSAKEASTEDIVTHIEQQFERIANHLKHEDIRNLSLEDQSLLLSQYGAKVITKNRHNVYAAKQEKELEKWKRKVVLLEAEVRRLKRQSN